MMGAEKERVMHEGNYTGEGRVCVLRCGNGDFGDSAQDGRRLC